MSIRNVQPPVPYPPVPFDVLRCILPPGTDRSFLRKAAWKNASVSGTFFDVQIVLFSCRSNSGIAHTPRIVWANSFMLISQSSYLESLLCGGFAESLASAGGDTQMTTDTYDYDSDSDLDDEEIDVPLTQTDASDTHFQSVEGQQAEAHSSVAVESNRTNSPHNDVQSDIVKPQLKGRERTIFISDMAFKTWHAFSFYLQFGETSFVPLASQHIPHRNSLNPDWWDFCMAPPCSPKSMYRLADKYDMQALKGVARDAIKSRLTADNVLDELFSSFTSRYPEMIQIEIDTLWELRNSPSVLSSLPRLIRQMVTGTLPHCGDAMASLIMRLADQNGPPHDSVILSEPVAALTVDEVDKGPVAPRRKKRVSKNDDL